MIDGIWSSRADPPCPEPRPTQLLSTLHTLRLDSAGLPQGLTGSQDRHWSLRPWPGRTGGPRATGLRTGKFCLLTPCSALPSRLCRSFSVTRSTAMKRTCQKSSQPSKVSWGCLPRLPAPHMWDSLPPSGEAAPLLFPECHVPGGLQDRVPSERGAGPSTCLQATPGPLSPRLQA